MRRVALTSCVLVVLAASPCRAQLAKLYEPDSLALIDFYEATNGDGWDNNSGWKQPGTWAYRWQGVGTTLVSPDLRRVTTLSLGRNNLVGELPESIGNLTELQLLNLQLNGLEGDLPESMTGLTKLTQLAIYINEFTGLPDLSHLPLDYLRMEGNGFDFADLEPLAGFVGREGVTFSYGGQDSVDVVQEVLPDGSVLLSGTAGGTGTTYQWFRDTYPQSIWTEPTYRVSVEELIEGHSYRYYASNAQLPALVLRSRDVSPTASGTYLAVNSDGDEPLPDGPVIPLCDVDPNTTGLQCTLRAALEIADAFDDVQIRFSGVSLIRPASALPAVTRNTLVEGALDVGRVEIRGDRAGQAHGLVISGDGATISNLAINGFSGYGIVVEAGQGTLVTSSRIGNGSANAAGGILIDGTANRVAIGTAEADDENVIWGGIAIPSPDVSNVFIGRNVMVLVDDGSAEDVVQLPLDVDQPGPSCVPWTTEKAPGWVFDAPPPKVLELTTTHVRGLTRPLATVGVYLVDWTGSGRGRYFARAVTPLGMASADESGAFDIPFDFDLTPGARVALTMTDVGGVTSELSQVRRPVVYLPGVGGSWLEAGNGDNLFLPTAVDIRWDPRDFGIDREKTSKLVNDRLLRLAMDPTGTTSPFGETVHPDGVLEQGIPYISQAQLPYFAVLDRLERAGFTGNSANADEPTLDLWRFAYDWRRDPAEVADDLRDRVDYLTRNLPSDVTAVACDVDIATHSNGGMVASSYLWKYRNHSRDHVNRLFMSAAPYWGTPQVTAAHVQGYLFGLEQALPVDLAWGQLTWVFQNLPDGYGLMPSRHFMDWIDAGVVGQELHYLTDFDGNPLFGYGGAYDFLTAPKVDPVSGGVRGMGRNGTMWTFEQEGMHEIINDWRSYAGPPQVFRHVGRLPLSTTLGWTASGVVPGGGLEMSRRREVGDTETHVAYRESIQPRMGWGDGTVALLSATLGGGVTPDDVPVGLRDFSGQESIWIEPFEYYPCDHVGIAGSACRSDDTGARALDRMVAILKSSYEVPEPVAGKTADESGIPATAESGLIRIRSSSPITVKVEDAAGRTTGPWQEERPDQILYEVPGLGYWVSRLNATLSFRTSEPLTVTVRAATGPAIVRASRAVSSGSEVRSELFDDQQLQGGGSLRFTITPAGEQTDALVERDANGDGSFEAVVEPAAELTAGDSTPPVPEPWPIAIRAYAETGAGDPSVTLHFPDVGGPVWDWSFEDVPSWVEPASDSGQSPAELEVTLAASTLSPGLHRDTLIVSLTYGSLTLTSEVPVELAIRDQAAVLSAISVYPVEGRLVAGDSLAFWAIGHDQLGLPMAVDPVWSATGGTIGPSGVYVAGPDGGLFTVTASSGDGSVSGSATVDIFSGVDVDEPAPLPDTFGLHQNYPNPFSRTTTIAFDLPETVPVFLEVFDLLGRRLRTLRERIMPVGRHSVVFDASDLPSGVYFYRLAAGPYAKTRSLLLVR